ncbi:MAG: hypothetical protein KatS3mg110_1975 [Pirellulaceae bacterium]|nr:MAG: hypothetical protein KatS3mg110_1975 [Pirellulaceae bacterium]
MKVSTEAQVRRQRSQQPRRPKHPNELRGS